MQQRHDIIMNIIQVICKKAERKKCTKKSCDKQKTEQNDRFKSKHTRSHIDYKRPIYCGN